MIIDKVLDILFAFLETILSKLPVMTMDVDLSVLFGFMDVLGFALYFFPWVKVLPILGLIMILQVWRIVVSVIRTIWEVLPLT